MRAANGHAYQTADNHWYIEPSDCTAALLGQEAFEGPVWDPACGWGRVVSACKTAGLEAFGTDIVDRTGNSPWFRGPRDFLKAPLLAREIITNPPFDSGRLTEAFIRRALSLRGLNRLAIFTEAGFLGSATRAMGLYRQAPPDRIYWLTPRPSCPPGHLYAKGKMKAEGGKADYIWLVWDCTGPHLGTAFHWLTRPSVK